MRVLLDTHTLYWWVYFPELLPPKVRNLLTDPDVTGLVSAVSAYEMSYKHHRGNWPETAGLVVAFERFVGAEGFEVLPLSAAHAIRAGGLPREHRDPFDRMLVAQAMVEGVALVTKDEPLRAMGVEVVWG